MIEAIRARPWSVHAFAFILLGTGLHGLIMGLVWLDEWLSTYQLMLPEFEWNQDWVIVALSARFSIVCIPVIAVWGWRKRIARTLITAFTAFALMGFVRRAIEPAAAQVDPEALVKMLLILVGCALLFTPSASRWLSRRERPSDVEVFE